MIGWLTGECILVGNEEVIINVGGVGYLVHCGQRTLRDVQAGMAVVLHIETHVREQSMTLYGFLQENERAWFVHLQSVQGVGPKAALAILDILTPDDILSAVNLEDRTRLTGASGIGPKVAARICAELADKPLPVERGLNHSMSTQTRVQSMGETMAGTMETDKIRHEAVSALVNLGFDSRQATQAVSAAWQTFSQTPDLEVLLKQALKDISDGG